MHAYMNSIEGVERDDNNVSLDFREDWGTPQYIYSSIQEGMSDAKSLYRERDGLKTNSVKE